MSKVFGRCKQSESRDSALLVSIFSPQQKRVILYIFRLYCFLRSGIQIWVAFTIMIHLVNITTLKLDGDFLQQLKFKRGIKLQCEFLLSAKFRNLFTENFHRIAVMAGLIRSYFTTGSPIYNCIIYMMITLQPLTCSRISGYLWLLRQVLLLRVLPVESQIIVQ